VPSRRALRHPRDPGITTGGNEFFPIHPGARIPARLRNWSGVSCSGSSRGVLAVERGLSLRLQHAEPGSKPKRGRRRSRSLVRRRNAAARTRSAWRADLNAGHGESSSDSGMRLVFKDVPVDLRYFPPVGGRSVPAGCCRTLGKYFQANGIGEVGHGPRE
jgi:hypothetical protein